jgi:acyl-CoA thioester hydrolase
MRKLKLSPPAGAATTRYTHRVAFYETDGMGIVHHSNYLRFLELARVAFLGEHDRDYTEYLAEGLHVPVIRIEASYHQPCRFADLIDITCWMQWARNASMGFAYRLEVRDRLVCCAVSEHAIVDDHGHPRRIPASMRARVEAWIGTPATP